MTASSSPEAPTVATGSEPPKPTSLRKRLLSFPMGPRTRLLNVGLAVGLVAALVIAFLEIGNPPNPTPVERTAVVTRGDVTAKVTGSGNAASQIAIPVSFATNGTITAVDVKAGDTVALGQVLATIDPTAANEALQTAQAGLAGSQAAYDQAAAGPTEVKKQQDQAAITQAQQAVDNANVSVTNAEKQRDLDSTAQSSAVKNAQTQLDNDQDSTATAVKQAQAQLRADTVAQNTAVSNARSSANSTTCTTTTTPVPLATSPSSPSSSPSSSSPSSSSPSSSSPSSSSPSSSSRSSSSRTTTTTAPPTTTIKPASTSCSSSTSANQSVTQAEQTQSSTLQKDRLAVTSAQQSQDATLDKDRQAITSARQTQSDTLLKDNQAIVTNKQSVTTAQGQLTNARLAAEADLHPQTPAQIAQAKSSVDSSRVQVDTAQVAVDQTQLKAPQAGVVLSVAGKVGESSGGSSESTGTSTGTGTTGTQAASAASSTASSAGSGFITIANLSQLAVTANIAEADAANIQLGQQATVTFPATNATATGSVTQITPQSTVTNNVVLYPIQVSLDTAPAGVGVGSTASLSITTGTANGVLEAPNAAITTIGSNHTVTVRRNGADTVVPVEIGKVGDTLTEVTSGLVQGDVLVLPSPAAPTTGGATGGFPRVGGGR